MNWEMLQAEQQFSKLMEAALTEPQPIYVRNQLTAFMVDANLFQEFLSWKRQNVEGTAPSQKRRQRGSAEGEVWMAPDFDAPLEDFQEYVE